MRRVLTDIDGDAQDAAVGGWLGRLARPAGTTRPAPVLEPPTPRRPGRCGGRRQDPVRLRTAGSAGASARAVMDHTHRAVLGQVQVDGKSNEITAFSHADPGGHPVMAVQARELALVRPMNTMWVDRGRAGWIAAA